MEPTEAKQRVAELVNCWIARAGLRKEAAAARAGMTYQMLYRAYLDPSRPLSRNPDRAIALVRAFAERLTEGERCRAAEALTLLDRTGTPLSRFAEVAECFPAHEWQAAFTAYLAAQGAGDPSARQRSLTRSESLPVHPVFFRTQPCCAAVYCGRVAVQLRLEVPEGALIETGRSVGGEEPSMEPYDHAERHPVDPPLRMQSSSTQAAQPEEHVVVTIRMLV